MSVVCNRRERESTFTSRTESSFLQLRRGQYNLTSTATRSSTHLCKQGRQNLNTQHTLDVTNNDKLQDNKGEGTNEDRRSTCDCTRQGCISLQRRCFFDNFDN